MTTYRIVIVNENLSSGAELGRILERAGHSIVGQAEQIADGVDLARQHRPDALFLSGDELELDRIISTAREIPAAIILTAIDLDTAILDALVSNPIYGFILKPYHEGQVLAALEIAVTRRKETLRLEHEVQLLQEKLESRKLIDRAKLLLIQNHQLSEADAFRQIQQQSMNNRKSMREVAQAIINTYEIRGK